MDVVKISDNEFKVIAQKMHEIELLYLLSNQVYSDYDYSKPYCEPYIILVKKEDVMMKLSKMKKEEQIIL